MRVRLESIGCRLNIGEIEETARSLAAHGCLIVGPGEVADLCIINSCTVTAVASRKSRQLIRHLRRSNPGSSVVVTGCYSELAPEETRALGVDLVVSNCDKDRLPELLEETGLLAGLEPGRTAETDVEPGDHGRRTRAFIKVQDGCDNRCTFCIVTVARGAGRSRPADQVVAEVHGLLAAGYREAVLSGVHLGSYGADLGLDRGLEHLVRRLLDETDVPRLRLSSLEPWDLDGEFFALLRNPRLLPHLHLPLQSGSDRILRRMGRKVDRSGFAELVARARSEASHVSISTDIMVGFPGETDADHESSIEFAAAMGFSRLHVFRFSPRQGTLAATMPDQVPGPVSQERSRQFIELGTELERAFNARFVGSERSVLWEERTDIGATARWNGLTDNYIRVSTEVEPYVDLANHVIPARLTATVPGGVLGEIDGLTVPTMIELSGRRASRPRVSGSKLRVLGS